MYRHWSYLIVVIVVCNLHLFPSSVIAEDPPQKPSTEQLLERWREWAKKIQLETYPRKVVRRYSMPWEQFNAADCIETTYSDGETYAAVKYQFRPMPGKELKHWDGNKIARITTPADSNNMVVLKKKDNDNGNGWIISEFLPRREKFGRPSDTVDALHVFTYLPGDTPPTNRAFDELYRIVNADRSDSDRVECEIVLKNPKIEETGTDYSKRKPLSFSVVFSKQHDWLPVEMRVEFDDPFLAYWEFSDWQDFGGIQVPFLVEYYLANDRSEPPVYYSQIQSIEKCSQAEVQEQTLLSTYGLPNLPDQKPPRKFGSVIIAVVVLCGLAIMGLGIIMYARRKK